MIGDDTVACTYAESKQDEQRSVNLFMCGAFMSVDYSSHHTSWRFYHVRNRIAVLGKTCPVVPGDDLVVPGYDFANLDPDRSILLPGHARF